MSRFLRLRALHLHSAIAVLLVMEPACRKRQAVIPVPPPAAAPSSQPHATLSPATQAQEPLPQQSAPAPASAPQTSPYQVNKSPQPATPRKPARSAVTPSVAPSAPPGQQTPAAAVPVPAAPVAPPQLVDIVPPDRQRQLNAAIDQSLMRAQGDLAAIASHELSKEQQGMVDQIRNLMQQAQTSRKTDLPGAKSLAERAEVLAKDLAGSFR